MQDPINIGRAGRQLGFYMLRALASPEGQHLLECVEKFLPKLADRTPGAVGRRRSYPLKAEVTKEVPKPRPGPSERHALGVRLKEAKAKLAGFETSAVDGPVQENIRFAAAEFNLDALDCEILSLALSARTDSHIRDFGNEVLQSLRLDHHRAIAALTGSDAAEIERRLLPKAPLPGSGLITVDEDFDESLVGRHAMLQAPSANARVMSRRHTDRAGWVTALLGEPMRAELTFADYAHISKQVDLAGRVLRGAAKARSEAEDATTTHGVNLMLFGAPGLGKTELAKVLAAECGLRLWAVGEADGDGGEPRRDERIAAMRTSQSLLRMTPDSVLLIDEAEDVLGSRSSFGSRRMEVSKVFVNRLLEANNVPVIWTCNSVGEMDPAVLRRMTLVIEMRQPDATTRERIWTRVVTREGLELPEGAVARLSRSWAMAAPAVVASAARAAHLAGGGESDLDNAIAGVMTVLGTGGASPNESDGSNFDHDLVVASQDLGRLADRLARPGAPTNWSVVFYGVPGSGKSEFARHLVTRCGMPVLRRRASDILDKYVGETEKTIAAIFSEARRTQSVVIIDEFEALALDRADAVRSWELSQVGEFLTWAENHPLPLICSTNLAGRIDPAMLDRFTFKIRLDALDPDRAAMAWARILGSEAPSPDLLPLGLTPRDFHRTKKKSGLLGLDDQETLLGWLREEVEARGSVRTKIGF